SSARLERFLQACAEDNIQVCNLTTAAQYFHVLRRQMKRKFVKPLIIMTPKSLLRAKFASSPAKEFTEGRFEEILGSPEFGRAERFSEDDEDHLVPRGAAKHGLVEFYRTAIAGNIRPRNRLCRPRLGRQPGRRRAGAPQARASLRGRGRVLHLRTVIAS